MNESIFVGVAEQTPYRRNAKPFAETFGDAMPAEAETFPLRGNRYDYREMVVARDRLPFAGVPDGIEALFIGCTHQATTGVPALESCLTMKAMRWAAGRDIAVRVWAYTPDGHSAGLVLVFCGTRQALSELEHPVILPTKTVLVA